ncbi:unnamed protein product [Didymodactylos carnosus]|uniref:Uncharacterized protein n=1 Tax=Didymodactylos carnosus TaxID=1234261 RepID=A0A8S2ERG1_9BILA|nr:unnamed protein product [Didymodactylos carnosus]CAF4027784.1 unnamed protein product [Didymodactylos carnosus]
MSRRDNIVIKSKRNPTQQPSSSVISAHLQPQDLSQLKTVVTSKEFLSGVVNALIGKIIDDKMLVYENRIKKLQSTIEDMPAHIEDLQYKCNDLEQYGRSCTVRIYGIKEEEKNENMSAIVINFAQKIGVNVTEQDIYASHHWGNRKNSTRPIIARFLRYETRLSLLHNRSKLRSIQDYKNVYINEDQTRFNYDLFMYARKVLTSCSYKERVSLLSFGS